MCGVDYSRYCLAQHHKPGQDLLWERPLNSAPRKTMGTYVGTITETEMATGGVVAWLEDGTVGSNQVVIEVNQSGTVSGSLLYMKVDNILIADYSHVSPCISSNDQVFTGNPTGFLEETSGVIVIEIQHTIIRTLTEGCSIGPDVKTIEYAYKQHFEVEIKDGVMYGTSISNIEDGHPVKAQFALKRQ